MAIWGQQVVPRGAKVVVLLPPRANHGPHGLVGSVLCCFWQRGQTDASRMKQIQIQTDPDLLNRPVSLRTGITDILKIPGFEYRYPQQACIRIRIHRSIRIR